MVLYILNESSRPNVMGDIEIFNSLQCLLDSIEAIDVRNNEFHAFTSDGSKILLTAESDTSVVEGQVEVVPRHVDDLRQLLFQYLIHIAEKRQFGIDAVRVRAAQGDLIQLVCLVPKKIIKSDTSKRKTKR